MKTRTLIIVVAAFVVFIIGIMTAGEHYLSENYVIPLPGSMIKTIIVYNGTVANRIGSIPASKITGIPTKNFGYIGYSKTLPLNSFSKEAYDNYYPQNFSYVEKNKREGIEVVQIYSNNSYIDISLYCR